MTADRSVLIPSQAYDMGTAFDLPDLAQRTDHNWFGPRSGKTR